MQNILQQKEEKTTQFHELNGYDHELEIQISKTKAEIYGLFNRFGHTLKLNELRRYFWKLAGLKAQRKPEYMAALDAHLIEGYS